MILVVSQSAPASAAQARTQIDAAQEREEAQPRYERSANGRLSISRQRVGNRINNRIESRIGRRVGQ